MNRAKTLVTALLIPALLLLAGCAALKLSPTPDAQHLAQQTQRLIETQAQVQALGDIDMLLSLDNELMAPRLRAGLSRALQDIPGWAFDDVAIDFYEGYVALDLSGHYAPEGDQRRAVTVAGDLVPYFEPGRLAWQVSLHQVDLAPGNTEPFGSDADLLLESLQANLRDRMGREALGAFAFDPLPLGILETGIRVRSPFELVRSESSELQGVLTLAELAALVTPDQTRLALDLGFVPALPNCESELTIGRALFAESVRNREPVAPAEGWAEHGAVGVFFTDALDVREETTLIHYWFADGEPAAVTELRVGPSARWRTWSSMPADSPDASHWQVLVVDKRSGCILTHRAIRLESPDEQQTTADVNGRSQATDFARLRAQFDQRSSTLGTMATEEVTGDEGISIIVSRAFFASALAESMYDLQLRVSAQVNESQPVRISSEVGAVASDRLDCEAQSCAEPRLCTLDYDSCPITRDTRDCSSCLIRNPLNNRCMREAEDPICLAARGSENERLDAQRQACISRETQRRDDCLEERDWEIANCRMRTALQVNACTEQRDAMDTRFRAGRPIATIDGDLAFAGPVTFQFSEFRLDPDLGRVRVMLSLEAGLTGSGTLGFTPLSEGGALAQCLERGSGALSAQLDLPPWQSGLVADLMVDDAALVAEWSGLIQPLEVTREPLMQFFAMRPQTLTNCRLHLEPRMLMAQTSGAGSDLLKGTIELDLRPEPTRITLLPAYFQLADQTWVGNAQLGKDAIRYQLRAAQ